MSDRRLTPLVLTLTIVAASLSTWSALAQSMRSITVTVSVQTEDGTPIARAPVKSVTRSDAAFAWTDASGNATMVLNVPPSDTLIGASLSGGYYFDMPRQEWFEAVAREDQLTALHYFQPDVFQSIAQGVDTYSVTVVGRPAVTVTGIVRDDTEEAKDRDVLVRNSRWGKPIPAGDPFVAKGVRRGAPAEIFVHMGYSPQVHSIFLTPAQTTTDFNLGEVFLINAPRTVPIDVTLTNRQGLFGPDLVTLQDAVALVRSDAAVVLSFQVHSATGKIADRIDPAPAPPVLPNVPPGVYYIAPGHLGAAVSLGLLDAVRAGRQADLDAAGVPKFTAAEGQPVTLQVDARAARDAIMACCPPQNP